MSMMKVITPEISWHERDPIYSVDFQPGNHAIQRLASGGVDKIVRIWEMTLDLEGKGNIEFLSNLRRHTATVNVVRFSKNGELLASAGDDSSIIIWKLSDVTAPANNIFAEEDTEEGKESWVCHKTLRGHLGDVADMSWSKDSCYLVSGSVDNSAIVWNVKKTQKIAFFNDHKSYVQGVAFDPLGDYIATLSSDRSLRIFSLSSKNIVNNVSKMLPVSGDGQTNTETKPKSVRIFQDDSLRSFFRRLEFAPDGQLLLTPAGCIEIGDKVVNSSFAFVRGAFSRPALYLPCGEKATTVVRANPQLFELRKACHSEDKESASENAKEWEKHKSVFSLPYRMVFAVATEDSVILYDTQQTMPVGLLKNIHYHQISDLSWTGDGKALIISSTDGFCTIATFGDGELGVLYKAEQESKEETLATNQDDITKATQKENSNKSQEKSSEKDQMAETPVTKYSDTPKKTDKDKEDGKINTALNIRRLGKTPPTPSGTRGSDDKKEKGANQTEESKSSPSEKSKSKSPGGVNTLLNIRRVGKDGSAHQVSSPEVKKQPQTDDTSASSPKEDKKEPKINTVLNIRRVAKDGSTQSVPKANKGKEEVKVDDSNSVSSPVGGKKDPNINTVLNVRRVVKNENSQLTDKSESTQNVCVDLKGSETSDPSGEKDVAKDEVKMDTKEKKNPLTLPEKIEKVHIEDVVMKEDIQNTEGEEKSATETQEKSNSSSEIKVVEANDVEMVDG